jgi:hypothetical protein
MLLYSFIGYSQENVLDKKISIEFNNNSIKDALVMIGQTADVAFAYNNLQELNKRVTKKYDNVAISYVLKDFFKGTSLKFRVIGDIITIYSRETINLKPPKKKTLTISGYIYDEGSGEPLIGATIYDNISKKGTASNTYGFYSLTLLNKAPILEISYIGFEIKTEKISLTSNKNLNFTLKPDITEFDEVVVRTNKSNPIATNDFSINILTPKSIESLPITFGENDVIKAIQLKSGVKSLGEGSSGVFVQGGNTDQNLILIDEAPVYNSSHLFGLVSVFNPDAIKNVEFYKGNFPAQFGGKISSVINCQMKDGNKQNLSYKGGIGTLTSHFSVDGPLIKEKLSFIVAARRSIRDIFQNPSKELSYVPQFYDLNFKINWNAGKRNRLFFSYYNGRDEINTNNDYFNTWGNSTITSRWTSTLTNKLFLTFSGIYSKYYNNLEFIDMNKDYQWLTGVEDASGKLNLSWYISPENTVKLGVESTCHKYTPGESADPDKSLFRVKALEYSAFFQQDINLTNWFGVNYGTRFSIFQNTGNAKWNVYDDYEAVGIDSNHFGIYNHYLSFEPRVTLNFKISKNQVVKLAYSKTTQYSQVLQNSIYSYTSIQTWMPATPNIKPLYADMFSFGLFASAGNKYKFNLEAYYKKTNNIIDYINHAQLVNYPYIESQIRKGKGKAYGICFTAIRKTEKLDMELSYTWSRVLYQITGINNGLEYPALHDIPSDIRFTAIFKPVERIGISTFWTYHTGYAVTLPVGNVSKNSSSYSGIAIYTDRNSSRFPAYHRLDLSVFLYPKNKNKRYKGIWSAGVYNAYSRMNPIGVNLSEGSRNTFYVYTLYRMIPYISYNFQF